MRVGGYEVERRIGRGGMAEVLLGREIGGPRAGSPVAIKRLLRPLAADPAYLELFAREARLATRLRHAGIVQVIGSGVEQGAPYLVMEYVDGCDLARLVRACASRAIRIPVAFALYVADSVAAALHHVHSLRGDDGRPLGVVHCDVSPSNVFISRSGEVKLGDFGVARMGQEPRAGAGTAGPGTGSSPLGKIRYVAPERLRGEVPGPAADVFGVGAVLFELLTNQPAFPGDHPEIVARLILSGERRPPSAYRADVPPGVDRVVLRAVAVEGRYPDAGALASDLAGLYDPADGNPLAIAALVRGVLGT